VHNAYFFKQCLVFLKKSSGIILRPWITFVSVSAFLLFVVPAAVRGEECALFSHFWPIFLRFVTNFAAIKKPFPKI